MCKGKKARRCHPFQPRSATTSTRPRRHRRARIPSVVVVFTAIRRHAVAKQRNFMHKFRNGVFVVRVVWHGTLLKYTIILYAVIVLLVYVYVRFSFSM